MNEEKRCWGDRRLRNKIRDGYSTNSFKTDIMASSKMRRFLDFELT